MLILACFMNRLAVHCSLYFVFVTHVCYIALFVFLSDKNILVSIKCCYTVHLLVVVIEAKLQI